MPMLILSYIIVLYSQHMIYVASNNSEYFEGEFSISIVSMLGFNSFDRSGVDIGGAGAEFEGSKKRRSPISAFWSLTITASTFGFQSYLRRCMVDSIIIKSYMNIVTKTGISHI